MRRCTVCGRSPREVKFWRDKTAHDGLKSRCAPCAAGFGRIDYRVKKYGFSATPAGTRGLPAAVITGIARLDPHVFGYVAECSRCHEEWPLDSEFFPADKSSFSGFSRWCHACHAEALLGVAPPKPEFYPIFFRQVKPEAPVFSGYIFNFRKEGRVCQGV